MFKELWNKLPRIDQIAPFLVITLIPVTYIVEATLFNSEPRPYPQNKERILNITPARLLICLALCSLLLPFVIVCGVIPTLILTPILATILTVNMLITDAHSLVNTFSEKFKIFWKARFESVFILGFAPLLLGVLMPWVWMADSFNRRFYHPLVVLFNLPVLITVGIPALAISLPGLAICAAAAVWSTIGVGIAEILPGNVRLKDRTIDAVVGATIAALTGIGLGYGSIMPVLTVAAAASGAIVLALEASHLWNRFSAQPQAEFDDSPNDSRISDDGSDKTRGFNPRDMTLVANVDEVPQRVYAPQMANAQQQSAADAAKPDVSKDPAPFTALMRQACQ